LSVKDLQIEPTLKTAGNALRTGGDLGEEKMIRGAMERTGGNISAAAKILGVSRPTLYAKLKKYGL
ncbi:MAG: sigma-54-dependent Fis family transcriptional regulator, partial [Bacteroidales bacterium]|nr:sigma-54-dependent Fis family transcriptional regulator [Bacteroidales bacterium]